MARAGPDHNHMADALRVPFGIFERHVAVAGMTEDGKPLETEMRAQPVEVVEHRLEADVAGGIFRPCGREAAMVDEDQPQLFAKRP